MPPPHRQRMWLMARKQRLRRRQWRRIQFLFPGGRFRGVNTACIADGSTFLPTVRVGKSTAGIHIGGFWHIKQTAAPAPTLARRGLHLRPRGPAELVQYRDSAADTVSQLAGK